MEGRRGTELVRWLKPRNSRDGGAAESRSVMDKERRDRTACLLLVVVVGVVVLAPSVAHVGGWGGQGAEGLAANMAVMLSGVLGRLGRETLSPSSLVKARPSMSSALAETEVARTRVGVCLPSGKMVRNSCACAVERRRVASGRALAILAVK